MNPQIQSDLEEMFLNGDCMPDDPDIQAGMFIMDPTPARSSPFWEAAMSGTHPPLEQCHDDRTAARLLFQAIKRYSLGIENGAITYGSVLNDEPLEGSEEWNDGVGWPQNVSRTYKGHMNVDDAIMISQTPRLPGLWRI